MSNEIEDSFGYNIALEVLCAHFESLKELISLSQCLAKHLLVLLKRVENLIAKLLIELHYEAGLIVLVLYIIPQVRVDVRSDTLECIVKVFLVFLVELLLSDDPVNVLLIIEINVIFIILISHSLAPLLLL